MEIDVLGTNYKIEYRKREDDKNLEQCDGYMDSSIKVIVVEEKEWEAMDKLDLKQYRKKVTRHEIVHAFLYESGLDGSSMSTNGAWATNEEMVDWFAIQSPKMFKAFEEAGCL